MTDPINLTQLREDPSLMQDGKLQVLPRWKLLALIDAAEAARKMVNEYIAGYYDQSDTFGELEQVLAKFTTNTNT